MGCGNVDAAAAVELALSRSAAGVGIEPAAGEQPCSVDGSDPAQWPREVNQTITFDTIPDRTIADPDFRLDAKASSGLPVEYEAHDNCTVRGNFVHMTGIGLCVITASQSGSVDFNPATPVMQALVISDEVTAIPLPARGRLGGLVTLRYRFNAIGFVTTTIVVQRNGRTIARFGRPYAEVEAGYIHTPAWRTTHARLPGSSASASRRATGCRHGCVAELRADSSSGRPRAQPPLIAATTSTRERVLERRVELRALPVDVDVDVRPQRRARLAEPVAQARPARRRARRSPRRRSAASTSHVRGRSPKSGVSVRREAQLGHQLLEHRHLDRPDRRQVARDLAPALALVGAREDLAGARAEVEAGLRRSRRSPSRRAARRGARRCCGRPLVEPLPALAGVARAPDRRLALGHRAARGPGRAG